jgi:hypothetical protein
MDIQKRMRLSRETVDNGKLLQSHFKFVNRRNRILHKSPTPMTERHRRRTSEELNNFERFSNRLRHVALWWELGDSPPPTHYLPLLLAALGFLVGMGLIYYALASKPSIKLNQYELPKFAQLIVGLGMSGTASYYLFISICCWRRVRGYDWWMIPYFG